jgi:hypothetical protein
MRRREFITLLGGAAASLVSWSRVALAQQQSGKVFRIGFLGLRTAESLRESLEAFRAGLGELGYREGQDFVIESRWADGKYDRLATLFADLIRLKVDVIVTHSTPGALAPKRPPPRFASPNLQPAFRQVEFLPTSPTHMKLSIERPLPLNLISCIGFCLGVVGAPSRFSISSSPISNSDC